MIFLQVMLFVQISIWTQIINLKALALYSLKRQQKQSMQCVSFFVNYMKNTLFFGHIKVQ